MVTQPSQMPAGIQDEVRLKNPTSDSVAGHQVPRSESRGQPPPDFGDQTTQRVEQQ